MVRLPEVPAARDPAWRLGHAVLGPVFTAFTILLLRAAASAGLRRLAFVARDGEFLLDLARRLAPHWPGALPDFAYLQLSRVATSLPAEPVFDIDSLRRAAAIRVDQLSAATLFGYYGIPASMLTGAGARLGLDLLAPLTDAAALGRLAPLLEDPALRTAIATRRAMQTRLLESYLRQHAVYDQPDVALVDIGWRGSIPRALCRAFPAAWRSVPLRVVQLGYRAPAGAGEADRVHIAGLLGDPARRRVLREVVPEQLAFLLEGVCRARHAPVVGYRAGAAGRVEPVCADDHPPHPLEQRTVGLQEALRDGIRAHLDAHRAAWMAHSDARLRELAQRQLLRLGFFPTREEVAVFGQLVHTEGHARTWARPLIDPVQPVWYRQPRRWLGGLSSPWRGGYVAASAGPAAAVAYYLFEAARARLPAGLQARIENLARRAGRVRNV